MNPAEPLRWAAERLIAIADDRAGSMPPEASTRWPGVRADLSARYGTRPTADGRESGRDDDDGPANDDGQDESAAPGLPGLQTIVATFDLDPLELRLLTITAAVHLDPGLGHAVMLLTGGGDPRPTVELALTVAETSTQDPQVLERLAPDSPLGAHGLLTINDGPLPLWARALGLPDHVLHFLVAGRSRDPLLDRAAVSTIALDDPAADDAAAAIRSGWPTVWIHDSFAGTGAALGAAALARLDVPALTVDLRRLPGGGAPTRDQLQRIGFAAATAGFGLEVVGAELAGADGWSVLSAAPVPLIGVSADRWPPLWPGRTPRLIAAAPLTRTDRQRVWEHVLGAEHNGDELAHLRVPIADMVAITRYAASLAEQAGSTDRSEGITPEQFRQAANDLSQLTADAHAASPQRRFTAPTFADIVLPDHAAAELNRLITWGRHRHSVRESSTLPTLGGTAGGLAAVFTGPPGTGKTLAAHIVAGELGLELMQVDLSAVVDKYIGETEKKLERAFREAEARDAVLFFDEADALFGSRSEVKNAHDRYANQEIAYLLQRVDQFDGICLLATNMRGHLDAAFTRRMHFVIGFGEPDAATRRRLWTTLLDHAGPGDPDDPVDVDELAAGIELPGGDLRNIVLAALFDAASDGGAVGMRHIRTAAVREYAKLGRRTPPGLTGA